MQTAPNVECVRGPVVRRIAADQRGLSTVEYVIILVLVAAIGIGAWAAMGQSVKCALGLAQGSFDEAINGGEQRASTCPKSGPSESGAGEAAGPSPEPSPPEEPTKTKVKRIN